MRKCTTCKRFTHFLSNGLEGRKECFSCRKQRRWNGGSQKFDSDAKHKSTYRAYDNKLKLKSVNIIKKDEAFSDKISGWVNIKKKGIADYYIKQNGKLIKIATLPFNAHMPKFLGKYILLKEEGAKQ